MFMRTIIHKCAEVTLVHQRYSEVALQMEHIGKNEYIAVFKVIFEPSDCKYPLCEDQFLK